MNEGMFLKALSGTVGVDRLLTSHGPTRRTMFSENRSNVPIIAK